jgi:suppressor of fused-like protein
MQEKHSTRKESFDSTASTEVATSEVLRTRTFDAIHIKLNCQLGAMLPLALKGRLKHGRHFTFKSDLTDSAITLVSTSVVGSIATEQTPFAAHGHWLQILLSDDFIEELLDDLSEMTEQQSIMMPKMYTWKGRQLTITIMPD